MSGSASIEGVTGPDDVTLTILDDDLVPIQGICNRTPRVRDRILVLLKNRHSFKGGCGDVNETHLAKLKSLDLGRNPSTESAFTMSLRSNDFEGLVNLERLYMRETGLRSLPAGVFSGLAALDTLELDNNRLSSLPAGVFSGLHSLKTLELHRNASLRSLPYDEFEALPNLTELLVDPEGRRGYQVAGGEGDAALEVAAGGRTTYQVRLTHRPVLRDGEPADVDGEFGHGRGGRDPGDAAVHPGELVPAPDGDGVRPGIGGRRDGDAEPHVRRGDAGPADPDGDATGAGERYQPLGRSADRGLPGTALEPRRGNRVHLPRRVQRGGRGHARRHAYARPDGGGRRRDRRGPRRRGDRRVGDHGHAGHPRGAVDLADARAGQHRVVGQRNSASGSTRWFAPRAARSPRSASGSACGRCPRRYRSTASPTG